MRTGLQIFWEGTKRFQRRLIVCLTFIALGLWIASPFTGMLPWELALGVSLSLLLVIMVLVLDHLVNLREFRVARFYHNQEAANREIVELIKEEKPSKAKLIEYSSRTVEDILKELRRAGASIELLLCDPRHTITCLNPCWGERDFQREERVCQAIKHLRYFTFYDYDKVNIKCYQAPGSLRGRKFDEKFIQVGWYTYDTRKDAAAFGWPQIWGDVNPVVTAPVASPEGRCLTNMFDEVFKNLWRESVTLKEACNNCPWSNPQSCFGVQADDWLKRVSP